MHEVSKELPNYFTNKFTRISSKQKRPNGKKYQPEFLSGVSGDAPEFFKLNYVPVLNKDFRFEIYSRLSTPLNWKKSCRSRYAGRKMSVDTNAGLPTGFSKHVGEFILPTPSINRSLTEDEENLKKYLERNCKSRIRRSYYGDSKEDVVVDSQRTTTSIIRPKTAKFSKTEQFTFIEPKVLTQKESRLLYNI